MGQAIADVHITIQYSVWACIQYVCPLHCICRCSSYFLCFNDTVLYSKKVTTFVSTCSTCITNLKSD